MDLFTKAKIRTLLILSFIALSTLPLLILGLVSFNESRNAITAKADLYVRQMVAQAVDNIDAIITDIESIKLTLMTDPEFYDLLTAAGDNGVPGRRKNFARVEQKLYNLGSSNQSLRSINFLTTDSHLLMSGDELPYKQRLRTPDEAGGGSGEPARPLAEGWFFLPEVNQHYYVVRTIRNAYTEKFLGTLILELERYLFQRVFAQLPLTETFDFFLVDGDRQIVAHRTSEKLGKRITQFDPQQFITIRQPCQNQWEAVAVVSVAYLTADVKRVWNWSVGIGLLGAALAVLLGIAIAVNITKPLEQIIGQMKKAEAGDMQAAVEISHTNEIGQVSFHFNAMMNSINTLNAKLVKERRDVETANRELRDLHQLLRNILDAMPSTIVGVDQNGIVMQWNREAARSTGIGPEAALGRPFVAVFPDLEAQHSVIQAAIANRQIMRAEKLHRYVNGESRICDLMAFPLVEHGIYGAVVRIDDITDRVQFEEMLIQTEKMVSVGGLAAGMAHEINNPLAGMMQNASVLNNRLLNDHIPANRAAATEVGVPVEAIAAYMKRRRVDRVLDDLTASGRRLSQVVKNMLDFARKSDGVASPCNPVALVEEALRLAETDYNLKKRYDFRSINIRTAFEDNLPMVPCEASKIHQVLLNIFSNGAYAMQKKKEQTPEYQPEFAITLTTEPVAAMLRIEISDNGPGIDSRIKQRIFEPFFTTKPIGTGTGLGLSVSYFIIFDHHNGTMDVNSEPGLGTTFIVRLPIQQPHSVTPAKLKTS